jgi:antitoxin component YwqK of YwqJK toxin-antitoxin module
MKRNPIFLLILSLVLLSSCSEANTKKKPTKKEVLVEVSNGIFTEYYPGRKAIKFKGPQDSNGQRNGRWFFYDEDGQEMSMTEYAHGKKNGFTFVRYPNGTMRYTGEYTDDVESGLWKFYDQQGNVNLEKNYAEK